MEIFYLVVATIVAYLLGAIPTSVWIGKIFYGIDVRDYGSGNAGTTNTFRILGKKAGIPVFLIDVLKAYGAVNLVRFFPYLPNTPSYVNLQLLFGIVAVIGHIFPIYVGFKGGKGVASLLGLTLAIVPIPALLAFAVFAVVLLISHYVSLGSMFAGCSFPFFVFFVERTSILSLQIFSILFAVLLLITHRKNIVRLKNGEESKIF